MAFSQFPAPAAGGAQDSAFAATIPDLMTTYEHIQDFTAGNYEISVFPLTTQASVTFVNTNDDSFIATITTTLGLATGQISSPSTRVYITTLTGGSTDAIVTITKTGAILTPDDIGNGTLDTITTTGTYNQTGVLGVLLFGGGSAGAKGPQGAAGQAGSAGGASGGVALGVVINNGATTVTVGAKGTAATSNNTNIVAPTQSSFGNIITSVTSGLFYVSGAGNGGGSPYGSGNAGSAGRAFVSFNSTDTTGGGGGSHPAKSSSGGTTSGGGSGIGTGGSGAPRNGPQDEANGQPTTPGTAGTGKASGGGAGCGTGNNFPNAAGRFGGDGADGVVYILRGF
jgi:hypothetical protein